MIIYMGNFSLDCTIMNDKYIGSGQPRVYGYVEMASNDEGSAAIYGLSGTVIDKQRITVVEALPLDKKAAEPFSKRPHKTTRQRV
jgi:RNA recognition motif-containing protein